MALVEVAASGVVFMQRIPISGNVVKRLLFVRISLMQRFGYSPVRYLSEFLFLPRVSDDLLFQAKDA